jgi:hypothetical protein
MANDTLKLRMTPQLAKYMAEHKQLFDELAQRSQEIRACKTDAERAAVHLAQFRAQCTQRQAIEARIRAANVIIITKPPISGSVSGSVG